MKPLVQILVRLARLVTVVFAVTALSFLLLNLLPGDPTLALLGPAAGDPTARAELKGSLDLDEPLPQRYASWLGNALQGDLGRSYFTQQTVVDSLAERLPLTLELMIMALAMALAGAIPIALLSAQRTDGWIDRTSRATSFALIGLPAFMLGILLIYVFTVRWTVFPASGQTPWFHVGSGVIATPRSIFLPAVTLAAGQFAVFTQVLRSDLVTTLRSDFILAARSKGISQWRIMVRHALRPSSFSLITLAGLSLGSLIGGAVIVEQMFALPGMGRLLVTSIYKRDYRIVQGMVVLIAVTFVIVSFFIEILYGILDPRIRSAQRSR